jgi:arylsulfatase A-like enzyme
MISKKWRILGLVGMLSLTSWAKAPNIVLIFCDDMGYTDIGCFGAQGYTTPHIDTLAKEGMRFTNFCVAQAVCSASRAALMTGCYPNRVGITSALLPNCPFGLSTEEKTIASLLKTGGYATAIIGKWHLGDAPEFSPLNHGFDTFYGLPYSNDMWPLRRKEWPTLKLRENRETVADILTLADQDTLTTRYTEKAVAFVKQNKDKPFFLYLAHSMPHVPLGVSSKFKGKSEQGMFGDVLMEIDWSVGEVMKTLKECGLEEETLVIFTSDNGPWLNWGNHAGTCRGLREGKGCSFDGGHRVPCVMRWPKQIPASTTCDRFATTLDILPTLATFAKVPLPERRIDGVDISKLLFNEPGDSPRRTFYYYYNSNDLEAVRRDNWKLVLPHTYRSYQGVKAGVDGKEGPYSKGTSPLALYNLTTDMGEQTDVQAQHPEIVAELQKLAASAREDLGDNITKAPGANRRPAGKIAQK